MEQNAISSQEYQFHWTDPVETGNKSLLFSGIEIMNDENEISP